MAVKKVGLVAGAALCAINMWTGAPLLAVWIGSKVQGNLTTLSMTAVCSWSGLLAPVVSRRGWARTAPTAGSPAPGGRPPAARHTSPWLRSMRDERESDVRRKFGISPVERIVVISVVAAVLAF